MKNKKVLRNLILLGILSYLGCFSSLLYADKQKEKVSSKKTSQKPPRLMPFTVSGKVTKNIYHDQGGKGVKNIRIKLVQIQLTKQEEKLIVETGKKSTTQLAAQDSKKIIKQVHVLRNVAVTDANGRFSFHIDAKQEGQKYTLIPKHPDLPAGKYFSSWKKEFTLDRNITYNFIFSPPKLIVKGRSKTTDGRSLIKTEMAIYEVLGPQQYRHIESKHTSYYIFSLDFVNYFGKNVVIRPRHPQVSEFGFGFTPKEMRFKLTFETVADFVYSGPLPDLTLPAAIITPNSISLKVSNVGNLRAGPFVVELWYNIYNTTTGENPGYEKEWSVSGLEAGASKWLPFSVTKRPHNRITFRRAIVDRGTKKQVIESNEGNNKWGEWRD